MEKPTQKNLQPKPGSSAGPEEDEPVFTPDEIAAATDPFSNPEAFKSLWTKAAALAAKQAREEAAALGLDVSCTHNGRLAVLKPDGRIVYVESFEKT